MKFFHGYPSIFFLYIEFNLYEFDFDYDLYEDGFYILR